MNQCGIDSKQGLHGLHRARAGLLFVIGNQHVAVSQSTSRTRFSPRSFRSRPSLSCVAFRATEWELRRCLRRGIELFVPSIRCVPRSSTYCSLGAPAQASSRASLIHTVAVRPVSACDRTWDESVFENILPIAWQRIQFSPLVGPDSMARTNWEILESPHLSAQPQSQRLRELSALQLHFDNSRLSFVCLHVSCRSAGLLRRSKL